MNQHPVHLRLHMGCGEALCSSWLRGSAPAMRKAPGAAPAARKRKPSDHRRERTRG
ncbi:MAG: hypothetical protein ACOY5W_05930 [Pseudomonadota bacterium]